MPPLAYLQSRNQYAPVAEQSYYRPEASQGQAPALHRLNPAATHRAAAGWPPAGTREEAQRREGLRGLPGEAVDTFSTAGILGFTLMSVAVCVRRVAFKYP
jgi:hypothetical protein